MVYVAQYWVSSFWFKEFPVTYPMGARFSCSACMKCYRSVQYTGYLSFGVLHILLSQSPSQKEAILTREHNTSAPARYQLVKNKATQIKSRQNQILNPVESVFFSLRQDFMSFWVSKSCGICGFIKCTRNAGNLIKRLYEISIFGPQLNLCAERLLKHPVYLDDREPDVIFQLYDLSFNISYKLEFTCLRAE